MLDLRFSDSMEEIHGSHGFWLLPFPDERVIKVFKNGRPIGQLQVYREMFIACEEPFNLLDNAVLHLIGLFPAITDFSFHWN